MDFSCHSALATKPDVISQPCVQLDDHPILVEPRANSARTRRENAAKEREIRKELRQMECELIAGGLLDKYWRDSFLS